ncbi:plasma membrane fusion protein PRM1 [Diplogelasinospora grovesii]|uniref:Plasma membrane fusion protein PRM1 n=1 Tax=Diplogelasinospora grovesii TaxID=303347 RepID=A0AAN6N464_9PEZI|nr:plasma membrane fusion protein PRM1 [Diplogelasinospora grovesii]
MEYSSEKPGAVPPMPSSLQQHEQFDTVELQDDAPRKLHWRQQADTDPDFTPYLGLRARLSQIWFNRWTVLLMLVLVRVILLTSSLNDDLGDAQVKAQSACTKVEDVGSAMASMPHYLSVGVNSLAAGGINKAISAMVDVLMMILTGVEQLILFVINMYVGTYACLIAAFIHGGLDVSTAVVEDTTKFINGQIDTITSAISSDLSSVQSAINSAFANIASGISSVFGGGGGSPPKIDISSHLNDLKNIKVDDTQFVKDLVSLNTNIPTFAQVENFTKNAIAIPFDLVKQQLNNSYANYAFDQSIFPVAQKQSLNFCSTNSRLNDFFQTLFEIVAKARIGFIVVIAILAILACVPMTMMEIRRYRKEKARAKTFTEHGFDPMDVVYIASRPLTAGVGIKLASKFKGKRNLLARWAIAYSTSFPALFVLSLAFAGFFSCFCQWILLRAIEKEAPALATQVGDFAGEVVTTLEHVSTQWATDANGVITHMNDEINKDVFGWVVNATTAVNDTLNTFDAEIDKAIDAVFQNTILYNTAKNLVNCLVERKIETVQAGLTWVHDNAHVSLPLFPNDTFSMGANQSVSGDSNLTSFLASPSSVTTDEISGAVDHVINIMHNNIVQEALISTALLLVYVIVVLIAVVRALAGMAVPERTRAEGGQRYVDHGSVRNYSNTEPNYNNTAPNYNDPEPNYNVVNMGNVKQGRTDLHRVPSHVTNSSYPVHLEDADR